MRLITVFTAWSVLAAFHASSAIAQDAISLDHIDWTKSCSTTDNGKYVCITSKHAHRRDGTPVISAQLIETGNESRDILRVTFPLGMQVVPGTRLIVDQDKPATAPYVSCLANGCTADYDITADMIGKLKNGTQLAVQAIKGDGKPISILFSLKNFAKIHDGLANEARIFAEPLKRPQPGSWDDDTLQPHLRR